MADDGPAVQAAINGVKAVGFGVVDLTGNFRIVEGVAISNASNILIKSHGGGIEYPAASETFFHLFRTNNCFNITFENLNIFSPPSLVRDDTGFAIQVSQTFVVRVLNCRFEDIPSACVWVDNSQDIIVSGNVIEAAKADGIHFSDGCLDFVCSDNTINQVEDDAIAVVRDVGGDIPRFGTITGNVVRDITRGHGVVLISCDNITVTGNDLSGFIGAAIGNYFWSGTTDRATNILIASNKIRGVASDPENAPSASAILFSAADGVVVKGNDIQGPGLIADYPNACVFFIDSSLDINIEGNDIHDSVKFGVLVNTTSGSIISGLRVFKNNWRNIVDTAVMANPGVGILGPITVEGNTFEEVAYGGGSTGRVIDIINAGASRVYIGGNKQIDQSRPYFADPANCTNIFAEDNTPALRLPFNPNGRASDGTPFTASLSTGFYWRSNGMIFMRIIVEVTTRGAGVGLRANAPFAGNGWGAALSYRETAVSGDVGLASFLPGETDVFLSPADAASGDPVADGTTIQIDGYYTAG